MQVEFSRAFSPDSAKLQLRRVDGTTEEVVGSDINLPVSDTTLAADRLSVSYKVVATKINQMISRRDENALKTP